MKRLLTVLFSAGLLAAGINHAYAQAIDVEINVNVRQAVGGISTFDREKFITIHSTIIDDEWTDKEYRGESNFTNDLLAAFFEGLDVYSGRDYVIREFSDYYLDDFAEDPAKSGWVQVSGGPDSMAERGAAARSWYTNQTYLHPYESRASSDILFFKFNPFWPDGTLNDGGWAFSQVDTPTEPLGSASGHYGGQYIKNFYSNAAQPGRPAPVYFEVANEPDYKLWGVNPPASPRLDLWKYHNSVADQVRSINTNVLVGGFCNAFPDHAYNDFQEWNVEWKSFIDHCGTNMDFYSLHFYDFDDIYAWWERKGSNLEATLDMIEHYSQLTVGKPLPFVISEYGGRDRALDSSSGVDWSSYRDWKNVKAWSSMLMSFADRPHLMLKTVPFVLCKHERGRVSTPYTWRLMRQAGEPSSYTGEWVYTDYVKFYQLWSDVRGTRVDTAASDPDIQVDAYVDGDKAYVILNNLDKTSRTVGLNLTEYHGNPVQSVREKNLYLNGSNIMTLDETTHAGSLASVELGAEGTVVLEYDFARPVIVSHTSDEEKHYATRYFQDIVLYTPYFFDINGVEKGPYGEAVLRLGMGRDKTLSRQPVVEFNGTSLTVPTDFMGHEGDGRDEFFGVLEIPVPYDLVQSSNEVQVYYTDSGGYISSLSLRTYAFSTDVRNGGPGPGPVFTTTALAGGDLILSVSNGIPGGVFDLMSSDLLETAGSNWIPSLQGLQFDASGEAVITNPVSGNQAFFRIWEPGTPAGGDGSPAMD